ncbi:MAG: nucleotide exchange factor GrpE [Candidatus Andersenbacteria bacterium]
MIYASTIHSVTADKTQEYLDGWKRARAELANVQSRIEEETQQSRQRIRRDLIEELLAVADNFYALAVHVPENLVNDPWAQGVLHISRQFDQTLADLGVTVIDPVGQVFNPSEHEAVEKIESSEHAKDDIAEVLQRGYALGDTVMRPAKVKVTT